MEQDGISAHHMSNVHKNRSFLKTFTAGSLRDIGYTLTSHDLDRPQTADAAKGLNIEV